MNENELCVLVHGGAGSIRREHAAKKVPFLREARDAAWKMLCSGKPGEYAVTAALRVMEGAEYFNAGFGGYPNIHGIVLLDVGLMRGDRSFISLLNVRRVKYPSAIALNMLKEHSALMTVWTHEMMQQVDNAPDFMKERYGLVKEHDDLIAPFIREMIERDEEFEVTAEVDEEDKIGGTVGCIVRDKFGNLCAGTSTGGVRLKYNGRIGDSPIIGSGVYADNEVGCLSTTGHGESLLLSLLSGFTIAEMRNQLRKNAKVFLENPDLLEELLQNEMDEMQRKTPGRGGAIIVIPPVGTPAFAFNSKMVSVGIRRGTPENLVEDDAFVLYSDGSRLE